MNELYARIANVTEATNYKHEIQTLENNKVRVEVWTPEIGELFFIFCPCLLKYASILMLNFSCKKFKLLKFERTHCVDFTELKTGLMVFMLVNLTSVCGYAGGLSENDFIFASKIDQIETKDLTRRLRTWF